MYMHRLLDARYKAIMAHLLRKKNTEQFSQPIIYLILTALFIKFSLYYLCLKNIK